MRIPLSITAALFCLFAGQGASAHAFLKTATPPVGATVTAAPPSLTIRFTEAVEPAFTTITVQDAAGFTCTTGPVHASDTPNTVAVPLRPLGPGVYRVIWHATAVDTHKTEGNYTFTVTP